LRSLGHHWAYRKAAGEPQLVFNFVQALADYLVNFTFSKSVTFKTDRAYQHIVPALLDRIWTIDNRKERTLWEMGQMGGIFGDVFIKVAYEEPYADGAGILHPGRVVIVPINPAHSFPKWHPHDRSRLTEFKQKYKFWSTEPDGTRTVRTYTEILTETRIKEYRDNELIRDTPNPLGVIPIVHIPNQIAPGSPWGLSDVWNIIPLNREYNEKATEISQILNYYCVDTETEALTRDGWKKHSELRAADELLTLNAATDDIEWQPAEEITRFRYDGDLVRWTNHIDALTTPNHRWLIEKKIGRPANRRYPRAIGRTASAADGDIAIPDLKGKIVVGGGTPAEFPTERKWSDELVETVGWYVTEGCDQYSPKGWHSILISQKKEPFVSDIRRLMAYWRAEGGTFSECKPRDDGVQVWYLGKGVKEALEEAAPRKQLTPGFLCSLTYHQARLLHKVLVDGDGTRRGDGGQQQWYQVDRGRLDSYQMLCAMLGIRTREHGGFVDEYRRRALDAESTVATARLETPTESIVWCPTVPNGLWLARRNGSVYWTGNTAPVTVVTGDKPRNAIRGPNKVWGFGNPDAKVFNLDGGSAGLPQALEYLGQLKERMHEFSGVPADALGQEQAISNTSGVALAIQYMPTMQKFGMKKITYGEGIQRICKLALLTLFIKEPQTVYYDPETDGIMEDGQQPFIDPADIRVYDIDVEWPQPLPVDIIVKLDELLKKLQLGILSKREAFRDLGEEFPDEKLRELFEEQLTDVKQDGSMRILKSLIDSIIIELTGTVPEGTEQVPPGPAPSADGTPAPAPPQPSPLVANVAKEVTAGMNRNLLADIVTQAWSPRVPMERNIDKNDND
jgi:hypothetical protein